jgi:hypothetical protein
MGLLEKMLLAKRTGKMQLNTPTKGCEHCDNAKKATLIIANSPGIDAKNFFVVCSCGSIWAIVPKEEREKSKAQRK